MSLRFALFVAMLLSTPAFAQIRDNLGSEFYLVFGANQGYDENENFMGVFITSRVPARGRVEVPAISFSTSFTTTPGVITRIALPSTTGTRSVEIRQSEMVFPGAAVHITADEEIAVFGMNHKKYSSDAFMAYPIEVLDSEYFAMSYPSSDLNNTETPGELQIAGIEDDTRVTITPRTRTEQGRAANVPFTVVLNAGDAYQVRGVATNPASDLTGTLIQSDKRIAVFSGHMRAEIPSDAVNIEGGTSRDILVEQMPPVGQWGDSAIVVPFATADRPELVRVISARNGNQISVNGRLMTTLDRGEFYEIPAISGVTTINATAPILVGQYAHTSWGALESTTRPAYGDPDLALVLPVEQFSRSYTIIAVEDTAYDASFCNIVIPSGEDSIAVYIDGVQLPSSRFKPVPNSRYYYTQQRLSQGTHNLSAPTPFGVTVYGLGEVDSYAYCAGALAKQLQAVPRHFLSSQSSVRALSNPFSAKTQLELNLDERGRIEIDAFDMLGKTVTRIAGHTLEPDTYFFQFDASALPAGNYLIAVRKDHEVIASTIVTKSE